MNVDWIWAPRRIHPRDITCDDAEGVRKASESAISGRQALILMDGLIRVWEGENGHSGVDGTGVWRRGAVRDADHGALGG